ncbi:hypothetical protein VCHA34P112_410011 [Vibrio chagasii]|nr:hypothetical protein VCHA34P112_410011 [Vibrio chagasii]CAH7242554.1 hypothetical protein VCHA56P515_380011 [Vibrio chagasii]
MGVREPKSSHFSIETKKALTNNVNEKCIYHLLYRAAGDYTLINFSCNGENIRKRLFSLLLLEGV